MKSVLNINIVSKGKHLFLIACAMLLSLHSFAVRIVGKVVNLATNAPINAVEIMDVHTGQEFVTLANGLFELDVNKGDLIEFRHSGYEIARVKIKSEMVANYYLIQLRAAATQIENQLIPDYFMAAKIDSIKRRELYAQALDHYQLTGMDVIQHPFDALSKRNQMIWRFQKNYQIWEKDKFVDYVFNDRLIVQLTGLNGDDLDEYKRLYRPSYDIIRGMNEYQYYTYVKNTVQQYLDRKAGKQKPVDIYNYDRDK